tara:strand:- start:1764 stop:1907 length:144 start_codon:yes stop_codon:yes gene_type:complete
MKKYLLIFTITLLSLLSFSGQSFAHCGDAEKHATDKSDKEKDKDKDA